MRNSTGTAFSIGAALLLLSIAVHGIGLGTPPMRATEGVIESQAIDLAARRGHDREGHALPVFVHVDGDLWLAPVPVYAAATLAAMNPAGSNHARWAAAACGAIDILLLYLLVSRCLRLPAIGAMTALALLATPAHLLFSRSAAIEGVWPVPFVLGWALGMTALADAPSRGARWMLAAGAASLAAATYTQPAAALTVPLLAAMSVWIVWRSDRWRMRDATAAAVAFAAVLLPLLIWYARFPRTYPDTLGRWVVHPAHLRSPVVWMSALTNWFRVAHVAALFWDFFAPSHLFLSPDARGYHGMFLTLTAVPVASGLRELLRSGRGQFPGAEIRAVIVSACIIGPLAAAMFDQPRAEGRALILVPFTLVIAAIGANAAWHRGGKLARGVLVASGIGMAVQALLQWS